MLLSLSRQAFLRCHYRVCAATTTAATTTVTAATSHPHHHLFYQNQYQHRSFAAVINGNQVRVGNVLEYKGKLVVVRRTQAVKPGKGGAFNQVELKDIRTGQKYNERLRASESVEKVRLDEEQLYDYLYEEGDKLVLMHKEDFSQIEVPKEMLSETEQKFLEEGLALRVQCYEGAPLIVKLPKTMVVEVASTEHFSKGNQASPTFKPATLPNGEVIKVPPFIESGEKIIIDTEEMEYNARAEK